MERLPGIIRVINRRIIILAAAVGATEEYLVQRKEIVKEPEYDWQNFLEHPIHNQLTDRIRGGIKRELEIVKKVDKTALVKGAATRVGKKFVGI